MWISPEELEIFRLFLEKHFPLLSSYFSKTHIRLLYLTLSWITGEKKGEAIWRYIESDLPFLEWITCFVDFFMHFHLVYFKKNRLSRIFIKSLQICSKGKKNF